MWRAIGLGSQMEVWSALGVLLVLVGAMGGRLPSHQEAWDRAVVKARGRRVVRVAAPLALTDIRGDTPSSEGVMPAIKLAVRHINRDKNTLKDYRFSVLTQDTQVRDTLNTNIEICTLIHNPWLLCCFYHRSLIIHWPYTCTLTPFKFIQCN